METDTGRVGAIAALDSDDTRSELIAHVHDHSRGVIHAELHRLSRRAPSLSPAELKIIDAALNDLAESLILHRLRTAPRGCAWARTGSRSAAFRSSPTTSHSAMSSAPKASGSVIQSVEQRSGNGVVRIVVKRPEDVDAVHLRLHDLLGRSPNASERG